MGKPKPVIVVTGPSGAGKGTLERILVERMPELELAVSATTRPQRRGEENGREYWFISGEEFERRVQAGEFLEWVPYVSGHRYGTLRSEIERIHDSGRTPLLDLEIEGALAVRDQVEGSVTIFVDAPAFEELERRLRERATESTGVIDERLATARRQLELQDQFDFVVRNDVKQQAADDLAAIIARTLDGAATMARP